MRPNPKWSSVIALALLGAAAGCGEPTAYEYPVRLQIEFDAKCPLRDAFCACSWNRIIHKMDPKEYENAMTRLATEGLMDPRLTEARLYCKEK
jgi:hypothetical protein